MYNMMLACMQGSAELEFAGHIRPHIADCALHSVPLYSEARVGLGKHGNIYHAPRPTKPRGQPVMSSVGVSDVTESKISQTQTKCHDNSCCGVIDCRPGESEHVTRQETDILPLFHGQYPRPPCPTLYSGSHADVGSLSGAAQLRYIAGFG